MSPLAGQTPAEGLPFVEDKCADTTGGEAQVGGRVLDLLTQAPLPGVAVSVHSLSWSGAASAQIVQTDDAGRFAICSIPWVGRTQLESFGAQSRSDPTEVDLDAGPNWIGNQYLDVTDPARIIGKVADQGSGDPVEGALVTVVGTRIRARSKEDGRFRIRGIPPGRVVLTTTHGEYAARTDSLVLDGGFGFQVELSLGHDVVEIAPITVTVTAEDFDGTTRRTRPFRGLTATEIDEVLPGVQSLRDLINRAHIPGLITSTSMGGRLCIQVIRRESGGCNSIQVQLNGVPLNDYGDVLMAMDPGAVRQIEYLTPMAAGVQFSRGDGAGVLLITTR